MLVDILKGNRWINDKKKMEGITRIHILENSFEICLTQSWQKQLNQTDSARMLGSIHRKKSTYPLCHLYSNTFVIQGELLDVRVSPGIIHFRKEIKTNIYILIAFDILVIEPYL